MAEEIVHKQEFVVRDLSTRSVTLYPSKAQVIRDINDVNLKPGTNEITIYGLTPTADESSIKVDGKGSATITDMMVDLIPNREEYEDVYPEESDEESDEADESDEDRGSSDDESELVKDLDRELEANDDAGKQASEDKASASGKLAMLETYGRSLDKDRPNNLQLCVSAYGEQREKAFAIHFSSEAKIRSLKKERIKIHKKRTKALEAIRKEKEKAEKVTKKEKEKAEKEKAKRLEKKLRAARENQDAKWRLKDDRIQFWPRKVYRVVVSLDTNADMTPGSSRRGSIDSLAKPGSERSTDSYRIALSISYITHSAWWAPRYELSLNSTNGSGLMLYRAEYCNTTSETWKEAKVILSTSEASFRGLGESIPIMQPWHIRLVKNTSDGVFGQRIDGASGALVSNYEMDHKRKGQLFVFNKDREPRNALFGLGNNVVSNDIFGPKHPQMQQQAIQRHGMHKPAPQGVNQQQAQSSSLFGAPKRQAPPQQVQSNSTFVYPRNTNTNTGGGLFGSTSNTNTNTGGGLFGSTGGHFGAELNTNRMSTSGILRTSHSGAIAFGDGPSSSSGFGAAAPSHSTDSTIDYVDNGPPDRLNEKEADEMVHDLPPLEAQESEWSESGMTASYEIPGTRTVAPSHTMRRHKIASIGLKDVQLSYLLVPKLRTVAFLKARIRNTSNISLLRGPVGLTLDETFLGNTLLPRCSADETFTLSLGVDPSVSVTYAKPVVKRSQSGIFQKEGTGVYTRTITITNTRSSRPLEGVVLDQIPVSEDERLKVEILQPAGLRSEGDSAKSGTSVATAGKPTEKWGTAKAVWKKAGEVCWNIKLEPGRGVKLVLEYEARFPSTEVVVGC